MLTSMAYQPLLELLQELLCFRAGVLQAAPRSREGHGDGACRLQRPRQTGSGPASDGSDNLRSLFASQTLLGTSLGSSWHRKLIARKFGSSKNRTCRHVSGATTNPTRSSKSRLFRVSRRRSEFDETSPRWRRTASRNLGGRLRARRWSPRNRSAALVFHRTHARRSALGKALARWAKG